MEQFRRASAIALSFALVLSHSTILAKSRDAKRFGIDNFGRIDPGYYRGAQPDADGFRELRRLGIRTVIDLREDAVREEARWVRSAGMRYVNIPLSTSRPATAAETEHFLDLVNDPANQPVYVHCKGGKHRTGEMTAIYRITHDGWTADQAYREMKEYKFYAFPFQGPLRDYVYRYYDEHQRTLARAGRGGGPAGGAGVTVAPAARQ